MGIRTRRVPPSWEHPKDAEGAFVPLYDGMCFDKDVAAWHKGSALWDQGLWEGAFGEVVEVEEKDKGLTYAEWDGERPDGRDYTPRWTPEEATHYQRYEDVTEGTPTSPVFETIEALLQWERECAERGKEPGVNLFSDEWP